MRISSLITTNREKFASPTRALILPEEGDLAGTLTEKLRQALKESDAVGVAANQIGELYSAIQVGHVTAFNPRIERAAGPIYKHTEGCLSLPGKIFTVERWAKVWVTYQTHKGKPILRIAEGFEAAVWQHEIDHLRGNLIEHGVENILGEK